MSRPIKLTQELIDECRQDFEKALSLTKLSDGKLSFTKAFSCGDRKAVVYFSAEAWAKMTMLIKEFDKEVAWHGVARRTEDESLDEYVIDDIVVYPQEVTGATVEMDTEKYALWIQENIEDERFNHIYMQGHSHVNMGTSPSSVDLNHQEEILGMLGDNDFYIFMIWNKSFASTNKIYDLKKNVMFEDKEIKDTGELRLVLRTIHLQVSPTTKRTARKKKTRISHLVKRTMERNPEPELELVGMDRMLAKNRCMAGKTKMTTTLMHT